MIPRQVPQVGKRFEHLASIAEDRVVQRHVPDPQRTESQLVGQPGHRGMMAQVGDPEGPPVFPGATLAVRGPVVVQRHFQANRKTAGAKQGLQSRTHDTPRVAVEKG